MTNQYITREKLARINDSLPDDLGVHHLVALCNAAIQDYIDSITDGVELPEPIGYLAWLGGKPCWDGDDCVCEDAVYPIDADDDRESKAIYAADQLRQAQAMARAKMLAELGKVEAPFGTFVERNDGTTEFRRTGEAHSPTAQGYKFWSLYTRPLPAKTSSLPERDASKPAEAQGLFHKFNITRTDGSDGPGGKHHGCEYFVLDVDHDQHAKPALQAYAAACAQSHPQLSADLIARHGQLPAQEFNPDWSQLEATQESLREHMAMLKAAQDVNAELVEALGNLLQDTQHKEHECGDEQCPVTKAHTALTNAKAAQQKEQK